MIEPSKKIFFRDFVDQYYTKIYRYIKTMIWEYSLEAEDLTQETFLKVFKKYDSFKNNAKMITWTYTIARNICIDHIRKEKVKYFFHLKKSKEHSFHDDYVDIETQTDDKETMILLRKAITQLPLKFRSIIILYHLEDHSIDEIAKLTSLKKGTIKSRLHYARQVLKKELHTLGYNPTKLKLSKP